MKRNRIALTAAVLAAAALTSATRAENRKADEFVPLFDGKTLSGWTTAEGGLGSWKVEDGAITCSGPASHLFSERGDFKNFHYRAEIKINKGGNSGMYFRTEKKKGFPPGYEAQVNSSHRDPVRTGSIYNRVLIKEKLVEDDAWFTQEVIVQGNHITVIVNGKTLYEFIDNQNSFGEGHFAWQHHDPGCKVQIRKAEVKEMR